MGTTIIVWLNYDNFKRYMNGEKVIGWSEKSKNEQIKLHVILSEVVEYFSHGEEGIEINIKRKVEE